jgi:fibronectin type 3 domain-containing protein
MTIFSRRVIVVSAAASLLATVTSAQRRNPPGVMVSNAVHHDLSRRLGDVVPLRPEGDEPAKEHPVGKPPAVAGTTGNPDPVVQTATAVLAPAPTRGFDGIGMTNYGVNAAPPDTNGAVGPNHYVQWVNEAFGVFDKSTGTLVYGPANGNTLWQGFGGPCQQFNDGDPIVLYDRAADRWLFSQFAVSQGSPYLQCIAVSQTSDPLGPYYRYSFSYTFMNDYPKFGIWPDAYYATHNMFENGSFFRGAKACAYDRTRMLQGLSATQQCFNTGEGSLLPSDLDGATPPPAGSPNYLLNFGANKLNLWKLHVDWTNAANSTFVGPTAIPVASFSTACNGGGSCVPQPGTSQKLDSLGDRLMYRLAYRNFGDHESLVVNHSVAVATGPGKGNQSVGLRWYELRNPGGVPSAYQQGTFAPDSTFRWMGSIAMDQAGDIAIGYSASSSLTKPGKRYTGRVPGDPLGTMQAETTALIGGGSQLSNLDRWGDYSSMSIDPSDDCTFWYTTEYLKTNGTFNWSTWITSFKFPSCGAGTTAPEAPTNLGATPGNMTVSLSWTGSSGASSYDVLRSTTSGGSYATIATSVTATSYTDTGLVNGTPYYYVVRAVNSAGTSPNSNEATATPFCAAPAAPSGLSATPGNRQVSLSWSASAGAASYNVKRSTTSGGQYATIASGVTATSYTDTDPSLINGTTYYYVVSGSNGCGEGTDSSQVAATPVAAPVPPPAPTGLTATPGPGSRKVTLTWTASSGATSYKVKRSTTSGSGYVTIATGVTATTYADTAFKSITTYYYVVSAVNSAGESANSSQASATPTASATRR